MWSEIFKQINLLKLLTDGATWLSKNIWSPAGIIIVLIALIAAAAVILMLAKFTLDIYVGLTESAEKAGFKFLLSKDSRDAVRRRINFCHILQSDIVNLSKTENWNDQFFTDLDAEVEAEGKFFASTWDRVRKRSSEGVRRAPSLMRAIETSGEQFTVLVGEPGSGKSVALRHLAMEMTRSSIRSKKTIEYIPLYINLKELEKPNEDLGFTANYIKQFVLDNVRRGDADTADYVKENWNLYRDSGQWFFLFDSFDEIPDVMHAPSGSDVIRHYSHAIRLFLSGMGQCRGVVASREYKGPEALPWPKVRILPLSLHRQDLLLKNSMLNSAQRSVALQHIAESNSPLHSNPMFLALMCRHIRKTGSAPSVDHELLVSHIRTLATRDDSYLTRKYNLNPDIILNFAKDISILMAEDSSLGLAPKYDDLRIKLIERGHQAGTVDLAIGALVDVKIGRTDVQEARPGDRRFTFSHRRYQETLYVDFLGKHPEHIPVNALLQSSNMREYVVALLQSQPSNVIRPILDHACKVLNSIQNISIKVNPGFGDLEYFDWTNDIAAHVCDILQSGLAARLGEVPDLLAQSIDNVLSRRWDIGDYFDKYMVLSVGGLLPKDILTKYIEYAVGSGESYLERKALSKVIFLNKIPDRLQKWISEEITEQTLAARSKAEILRVKAFSQSLPEDIGAQVSCSRALSLRRFGSPFLILIQSIDIFTDRFRSKIWNDIQPRTATIINPHRKLKIISISMFFEGLAAISFGSRIPSSSLLAAGTIVVICSLLVLYHTAVCATPSKKSWWSYSKDHFLPNWKNIISEVIYFLTFTTALLATVIPALLGDLISRYFFKTGPIDKIFYLASLFLTTTAISLILISRDKRRTNLNINDLVFFKNSASKLEHPLPLMAVTFRQLRDWAAADPASIFGTISESRSLLRVIAAIEDMQAGLPSAPLTQARGYSRISAAIIVRLLPAI